MTTVLTTGKIWSPGVPTRRASNHSPLLKRVLNGDLGVAKDVGVLSDLLGKRSTADYPDDAKSLVLQHFL